MSPDRAGAGSATGGIGVLIGLVVFAVVVASGVLAGGSLPFGQGGDRDQETARRPPPEQARVRPAAPTELVVRSVGIDASVRSVGLDDDLALRPPRQPELVGWWDESARPGADDGLRGGTVIAGHTVHDPAADDPAADSTGADDPGADDPGADDPGADEPGADDPGGDRSDREPGDREPGGGAMDRLPEVAEGARVVVRTENGAVRYRVSRVERYSKAELAERSERIFDQGREHRLVLVTCEDWNGEEYLSNVVIFAQPLPVAA